MNIKIQGGGSGTYANTGSCTGVTTYLQHEDLERMKNGREVQPFFNNSRDYISAQERNSFFDTLLDFASLSSRANVFRSMVTEVVVSLSIQLRF